LASGSISSRSAFRSIAIRLSRSSNRPSIDLTQFSHVVLHPYRLLILKMLAGPPLDFQELKRNLGDISDGNLASHLRALEDLGFVGYEKTLNERRVRTTYAITKKGFQEYVGLTDALSKWLDIGRH
jgi:DNA-binding HxlR family transcriptional regulator